jgi:hypothetical protein
MSSKTPCCPDNCNTIDDLRVAIHANRVSFPVPVPMFAFQHRPEVQWRLAELYFVHGWSPAELGERYRITTSRVRQSLRNWVQRARMLGYLQAVPPGEEPVAPLALAAAAFGQAQPRLQELA